MKREITPWLVSLSFLVCSLTFSPFAHADYRFVSFEYPGGINTVPHGINDHGEIVGYYQDGTRYRGFFYSEDTFLTIDFPGARHTYLRGINNDGKIVGHYYGEGVIELRGFVYENGAFKPLNVPEALRTLPEDVNNTGQIVGYYTDQRHRRHGFVYAEDLSNPSFVTLDFHEADTLLRGINDNGVIVGSFVDDRGEHGLLYEDGEFSVLDHGSVDYEESAADRWLWGVTIISAINNSKQIVGWYGYGGYETAVVHAFIYQYGAFEPLDYTNHGWNGMLGINNTGEMVGHFDGGGNGFTTLAIGGGEPGGCSQQDLDAAYQQGYQAGLAVGAANPVPGGGGCSTYDFFTGLLNIPCFTMGGENSYWFDLLLAPQGWSIMDYGVN